MEVLHEQKTEDISILLSPDEVGVLRGDELYVPMLTTEFGRDRFLVMVFTEKCFGTTLRPFIDVYEQESKGQGGPVREFSIHLSQQAYDTLQAGGNCGTRMANGLSSKLNLYVGESWEEVAERLAR